MIGRRKKPPQIAHNGPVRKVVRRSHRGFVCLFPSQKSSIPVECESLLELDFVRLAEANPAITSILHQPREIIWLDGSFKRTHVPDFAVTYRDKPVIVEIKPAKDAANPDVVWRTKTITRQLANEGILYRLLTEKFVRREPDLTLAKLALRGMDHYPSTAQQEAVLDCLVKAQGDLSINDICTALSKPPAFVNAILAMVLAGELVFAEIPATSDPKDIEPGFLTVKILKCTS